MCVARMRQRVLLQSLSLFHSLSLFLTLSLTRSLSFSTLFYFIPRTECVNLDEFDSARTLTLIPPDGEFVGEWVGRWDTDY